MTGLDRLAMAAGLSTFRRPGEVVAALRSVGHAAVELLWDQLEQAQRDVARELAESLANKGFDVLLLGDADYPAQLKDLRLPPPILYWSGELRLIARNGVGMCGSRHASDAGLRAARACGAAVASTGLVVVSGNARGVDAEVHKAALEAGGTTILVLAEGPLHYRPRRSLLENSDEGSVLVLSQFAPQMSWNVGNAMTRNGVIAALGQALIVIEAGSEGGTLDAGLQGLAIGRPVIALQFETTETPPGNEILHRKGAVAVSRPADLKSTLEMLAREGPAQRSLELGAAP